MVSMWTFVLLLNCERLTATNQLRQFHYHISDSTLQGHACVRAQLVQRLEVRRQARAAHHAPHVAGACRQRSNLRHAHVRTCAAEHAILLWATCSLEQQPAAKKSKQKACSRLPESNSDLVMPARYVGSSCLSASPAQSHAASSRAKAEVGPEISLASTVPGHITATTLLPDHGLLYQLCQQVRTSRVHRARALVVGGHDEGAVERDGDGAHGGAHLGHQLAAARVRGQVPHPDVAVLVACARIPCSGREQHGMHCCTGSAGTRPAHAHFAVLTRLPAPHLEAGSDIRAWYCACASSDCPT